MEFIYNHVKLSNKVVVTSDDVGTVCNGSMPVKKRALKRRATGSSTGLTIKNNKKQKCEYRFVASRNVLTTGCHSTVLTHQSLSGKKYSLPYM
jgi:hypothetical protein